MFSQCFLLKKKIKHLTLKIVLSIISSLKKLIRINISKDAIFTMETFYGCSSLKELNIQNLNTDYIKIMSNIFGECSSL